MSPPSEPLWTDLCRAGLVAGPPPDAGEPDAPWFVKALLAVSGWFAAAFLLGFLGVGFEFLFRESGVALVAGALVIGGAYVLLREPKNHFVEHLALAISLAGQALLIFGLFDILDGGDSFPWLLIAVVQTALAVVMPNFIHRALSSCFASISVAMAMADMRLPYLFAPLVLAGSAWLWLNEFKYPAQMHRIRPIGYGLVLSVTLLTGLALFGMVAFGAIMSGERPDLLIRPWIGELLTGAVLLYVAWRILRDLGHRITQPVSVAVLLASLAVAGASMEATGVTAGLTILLLGFAGSNRVLMGLGAASLLFYISTYYYLTDTTLMQKAQTLGAAGIVMLVARYLMLRVMSKTDGSNHA